MAQPTDPRDRRFAHEAMRTRFELVVEDDLALPQARGVAEEVFAEIDRIEALLSAFAPEADLFRVNAARGAAVRVDARLIDFLEAARALVVETGGAFDPTVGPIIAHLRAGTATQDELDRACAAIGFAAQVKIDASAGTVALAHPDARLDPGALGKGYALDRAAALLGELAIGNALLHAGTSSVLALGSPRDTEAWHIAVAAPPGVAAEGSRDTGRLAVAHLRNASLSVSAPHGRALPWPDGGTGHVVDPTTGGPAAGARLAAVVAETGAVAEAWSTALLCRGTDGLESLARHHPGASAMVLPATGAAVTVGAAFGDR